MSDAVMVPREPTEAMLNAGWSVSNHDIGDGEMSLIWSAMLAASTPVGGCGHTPGYRNGPHKTCSLCGQTHWSPEMPSSAPPPPSVSIDNGSRPQEAVPTEGHDAAVLAAFAGFVSAIKHAPISWETGCCCCGSPVEGHGFGDGHSPVDEGSYFVSSAIKAAEEAIAKATPQPADGCSSNEGADGWIEHDGGPNPVPGQRVDVRWRDGEVSTDEPSRDWCWKPTDGDDTIIAYRIAGSAHD